MVPRNKNQNSAFQHQFMKNLSLIFFLAIATILTISCEPEEEKLSGSSSINLRFSTDTVIFDTLLTIRTSITKRLRIFNPSKNAVSISSIRLGKGKQSAYTIIANGKFGEEINNEVLFGGDSLLVLVDVDIDPLNKNLPYLVKDSIVVDWNGQSAHVKLVAWGQDANFINGEVLCDVTWTADRPYVIYNFVVVDSLCTLTIDSGAKIFLDNGAAMIVQGTLKVLGDSANRVTFRNTRFDDNYQKAPGQWQGLIFMETSRNNEIHFADIENGQTGIGVGYTILQLTDGSSLLWPELGAATTEIQIHNTSIRHMSTAGILAFSSELTMTNSEIYNSQLMVGNFGGGTYLYEHCTFSNQRSDFLLDAPSFQFSDEYLELAMFIDGYELLEDLNMTIRNSIIWGPNKEEFYFLQSEKANFTLEMNSSIIKTEEDYGTTNYSSIESNFPGFVDLFDFNYQLDSLSFARDRGIDLGYKYDILGRPRDSKPDIGAYERIDR
jgi:hypothetical protein